MESKIAGYKLVPAINDCDDCAFRVVYHNTKGHCTAWMKEDLIKDCIKNNAIYVPVDTAIEVPKVNQLEK